jgi:hypothetical protein
MSKQEKEKLLSEEEKSAEITELESAQPQQKLKMKKRPTRWKSLKKRPLPQPQLS